VRAYVHKRGDERQDLVRSTEHEDKQALLGCFLAGKSETQDQRWVDKIGVERFMSKMRSPKCFAHCPYGSIPQVWMQLFMERRLANADMMQVDF
jgi:hypothetical protein